MKFEIKKIFTKKRIVIGIALAVLIILAVGLFGVYKNKKIKQQLTQEGFTQDYKNPSLTNAKSESDWQAYQNSAFSYSLNYPKDWHIFADDADTTALTEVDLGNGEKAKQGSSVFWSNKDSIEYAEESRPQDFRLVGMTCMKKPIRISISWQFRLDLPKKLGRKVSYFRRAILSAKNIFPWARLILHLVRRLFSRTVINFMFFIWHSLKMIRTA